MLGKWCAQTGVATARWTTEMCGDAIHLPSTMVSIDASSLLAATLPPDSNHASPIQQAPFWAEVSVSPPGHAGSREEA